MKPSRRIRPSHEPVSRIVAFRPLQRPIPESARKQPEGCGPPGLRFMGRVHGSKAVEASPEPSLWTAAFRPLQRRTPERGRKQLKGCGSHGFRFMGCMHGFRAVETSHEARSHRQLLECASPLCALHGSVHGARQSQGDCVLQLRVAIGPGPVKLKLERGAKELRLLAQSAGSAAWFELLTHVLDPALRPYLHPVRDLSGHVVLTDNRPADHPWQHGIFTGFHRVNGFNYWKEDEGRQRFVKLLESNQSDSRVSWKSLTELVDPGGRVVLEEEQSVAVHAAREPGAREQGSAGIAGFYFIDFDFLLRARSQDVTFGKFGVGGLAARMPWDQANPKQTHLNSNGLRGRECEQKRAQWCNVERLFGNETFGIAILDHPSNPNHPSGWRVDEQGLINPAVSMLGDWSLPAGSERKFRYRVLIYQRSASKEWLEEQFEKYASEK